MHINGTIARHVFDSGHLHPVGDSSAVTETASTAAVDGGWQAGYYVIVVLLVYGMSVVFLIASHVNRKHRKILEDRQIHKYLKEFQVVKERSSRDSYRNLKKAIVVKLYRGGGGGGSSGPGADRRSSNGSFKSGGVHRYLSKTVLPISNLAYSTAMSTASFRYDDQAGVDQMTADDRLRDACLYNTFLIEEVATSQRMKRLASQEFTVRVTQQDNNSTRSDARSSSSSRRKKARKAYEFSRSTKNVTAEISFPQLTRSLGLKPDCSPASIHRAVPTHGVSVAVRGSFKIDETCTGSHSIIHLQPKIGAENLGRIFTDSSTVTHNRRIVRPTTNTSPKPQSHRLLTRFPRCAEHHHAGYGPSRQHNHRMVSRSVCNSRSPNPFKISSV